MGQNQIEVKFCPALQLSLLRTIVSQMKSWSCTAWETS